MEAPQTGKQGSVRRFCPDVPKASSDVAADCADGSIATQSDPDWINPAIASRHRANAH
jgi:hypothetical protein